MPGGRDHRGGRVKRVVVVGASLGGLSTAAALRRNGFDGSVTLIGNEADEPYDRPPLSKQLLSGAWDVARTSLHTQQELADLGLELRLGQRARALDTSAKAVELADGEQVPYDALVIATGVSPRTLPGTAEVDGMFTLRTRADALAIRHALDKRPRVAVIGGGFVGAEVAAEARRRDLPVTLIEAMPVPLSRGLGQRMGEVCARLHVRQGVRVLCGSTVTAVHGTPGVEAVRLSDGSIVEADLVVVGIGATPAVDWLAGSGLALDDGVVCDSFCRASAPDVYAVGDVCRWLHPDEGRLARAEHWTNAREQAATVAHNLLNPAAPRAHCPVPYVWSDQYGVRIQVAGRSSDDVHVVYQSDDLDGGLLALYRQGDRLVGALAVNAAKRLLPYRQLLGRRAGWGEALAAI